MPFLGPERRFERLLQIYFAATAAETRNALSIDLRNHRIAIPVRAQRLWPQEKIVFVVRVSRVVAGNGQANRRIVRKALVQPRRGSSPGFDALRQLAQQYS